MAEALNYILNLQRVSESDTPTFISPLDAKFTLGGELSLRCKRRSHHLNFLDLFHCIVAGSTHRYSMTHDPLLSIRPSLAEGSSGDFLPIEHPDTLQAAKKIHVCCADHTLVRE
jgi:hypothetical protein